MSKDVSDLFWGLCLFIAVNAIAIHVHICNLEEMVRKLRAEKPKEQSQ